MNVILHESHCIFPVPEIRKTADYYSRVLGFRAVEYLEAESPHICLYRDGVEIILTVSATPAIYPNHVLYGYGYDAYIITDNQSELQAELLSKGAKIVRTLQITDYHNSEFVLEDIDGRWLGFGIKTEK